MTSFTDRLSRLPPLGVGVGYRGPLRPLFSQPHAHVRCIEVVAEHFFSQSAPRPALFGSRPVLAHCLDLSLGTPGPLDLGYVKKIVDVYHRLGAVLLSDHLAFTKTPEVDLGHLNPVPPTRANARMIAEKIREVVEIADCLFLLENITTHLPLRGDMSAAEFYGEICEAADCGMLLDVTNVFVNCMNLGRDPLSYIESLDLGRVVQLHLVGYSRRAETLFDSHEEDISEDLFALTEEVIRRAPVRSVIIERDGNYPPLETLCREAARLEAMLGGCAPEGS